MWLYTIVIALVILGVVGGVFAGGIFTIILVPIALIVLFSGLAYSLMARAPEAGRLTPTTRCRISHGTSGPTCRLPLSGSRTLAAHISSRLRVPVRSPTPGLLSCPWHG
jgi:hypothetical protein